MKLSLKNLKKKNVIVPITGILMTLMIGIGIGAIYYASTLSQTVLLLDVSGQFSLSVDQPIESVAFKTDVISSSIQIQRLNPNMEQNWRLTIAVANMDTLDLLESQIVGNSELFELDHVSSVVPYLSMAFVDNGSNIYAVVASLPDWSGLITMGDICFLDFDLQFNNGASSGSIEITISLTDWI